MKKKVVWVVVSCLMVAALLLASCAPAVVDEEKVAPPVKEEVVPKEEVVVPKEEVVVPGKKAEMVKWTGTKLDGTVVEKMIEKPRYGGVHMIGRDEQPTQWDDVPRGAPRSWNLNPVNEQLLTRNWTRGAIGTGEWSPLSDLFPPLGLEAGALAESWELVDESTLVFQIRKGVHWALDPTSEASRLVGGREMTAEDVAYTLRREFNQKSYAGARAPYLTDMINRENSIYVSPTDPWTVVIKVTPGDAGTVYGACAVRIYITPPELVEKYKEIIDWKNVVGTGPFILKEYVSGSSLTYVRNPDYWQHDPFFPENQLPYADALSVLIVPDMSTRQAALRTGRIDYLYDLTSEDCEPLLATNPELGWGKTVADNSNAIHMRQDDPALPLYDVRVRRALMMAINNPEIQDVYYEGKAELTQYPIANIPEFSGMYTPLEEMSESIRELYEYNPDKARQLLAEAGYPEGFKTEVITIELYVDLLSIIKEYWADIGVDLKIDVKDITSFTSLAIGKTYAQMVMSTCAGATPTNLTAVRVGQKINYGTVTDPRVEADFPPMNAAYFDKAKQDQIMKDLAPYLKEHAFVLDMPTPHIYTVWQPWLKNFYGTGGTGYKNEWGHIGYIWLDQELKAALGH
ncbi:ABC transporter substrate-binding protein [Chloroflexota bacterium]